MTRKWNDNVYGDLFFLSGGVIFTVSWWGSWWAALPAALTVAWAILTYQRIRGFRKGNEPEKSQGGADA
jgi:hypothetical protein